MRPGTSPDACAHPAPCPGLACLLPPQPECGEEARRQEGLRTVFVSPFGGREEKPGLNFVFRSTISPQT